MGTALAVPISAMAVATAIKVALTFIHLLLGSVAALGSDVAPWKRGVFGMNTESKTRRTWRAFCGTHRLVALAPVLDLLLRAKHLLSEAQSPNRRAIKGGCGGRVEKPKVPRIGARGA